MLGLGALTLDSLYFPIFPGLGLGGGITLTVSSNKPMPPSQANHSSQSSTPIHNCQSSQYSRHGRTSNTCQPSFLGCLFALDILGRPVILVSLSSLVIIISLALGLGWHKPQP